MGEKNTFLSNLWVSGGAGSGRIVWGRPWGNWTKESKKSQVRGAFLVKKVFLVLKKTWWQYIFT